MLLCLSTEGCLHANDAICTDAESPNGSPTWEAWGVQHEGDPTQKTPRPVATKHHSIERRSRIPAPQSLQLQMVSLDVHEH